jgi:hypothetical protein
MIDYLLSYRALCHRPLEWDRLLYARDRAIKDRALDLIQVLLALLFVCVRASPDTKRDATHNIANKRLATRESFRRSPGRRVDKCAPERVPDAPPIDPPHMQERTRTVTSSDCRHAKSSGMPVHFFSTTSNVLLAAPHSTRHCTTGCWTSLHWRAGSAGRR